MPNCYYYDEQRNHCKCYVNENLNELLAENAKLRELVADVREALCLDKTSLFREAIIKSLEDDMRELGIEVDG